jgi:hypothetical protein
MLNGPDMANGRDSMMSDSGSDDEDTSARQQQQKKKKKCGGGLGGMLGSAMGVGC